MHFIARLPLEAFQHHSRHNRKVHCAPWAQHYDFPFINPIFNLQCAVRFATPSCQSSLAKQV